MGLSSFNKHLMIGSRIGLTLNFLTVDIGSSGMKVYSEHMVKGIMRLKRTL